MSTSVAPSLFAGGTLHYIQRPRWLAFKPNKKSSTTDHAEENNMASPTQTVVGKGIPNPLIAENLLKILRDLIPPLPLKSLINSLP